MLFFYQLVWTEVTEVKTSVTFCVVTAMYDMHMNVQV